MTVVTYTRRENKLGKLIGAFGGLRVDAAVERAETNVESLRDACVEEIDRLLGALAASVSVAAQTSTAEAKMEVYQGAKALAGIAGTGGLDGVGEVAYSLCELSDRYIHADRWNVAAVGVHLGAMQVLRDPKTSADETARRSVLEGLAEVVRRAEAQT